jgi:hypothetical protein
MPANRVEHALGRFVGRRFERLHVDVRLGRAVRRTSVSRSALSHTDRPLARIAARVSPSMKAPPPVARTQRAPASSRAITRRSPSRKAGSP